MERRRFLHAFAATTAVIGFDSSVGSWITKAKAHGGYRGIPRLDGELLTADAELQPFATDAGFTIYKQPRAVLRPGSVKDISKMVRFCRRHGISVAARGQGHTTDGQSLASLMIDMSTLAAVHAVDDHTITVEAGLTWRELLDITVPRGYAPPNLTGYTGLSVGGTLSVGGISASPDRGGQVDDVLELQVVTGKGKVETCSETENPGLFHAALGGLGQCAIITKAVVQLIPAMDRSLTLRLPYFDNATFFADLRELLNRNEFDDLYCFWVPGGPSGWTYVLHAIKFYDEGTDVDTDHLLRGLSHFAPGVTTVDETYREYLATVYLGIEQLRAAGLWDDVMHPWFDAFLPDATVEQYVGEVLPTLTPEDVGVGGFMLLFPKRRARFSRPFFRVPEEGEWVFLFDILTSRDIPGYDAEFEERMLSRNDALFERARELGGTRYPIGTLTFTTNDWRQHYGDVYREFRALQRHYDPSGILTPGPKIRP